MTSMTVPVRRIPPLGGFNLTFLALEIRRLLRNRRMVIFTLALPVVFFLIFGANQSYSNEPAGSGNVEAFVMISMAVYGAMLGTTATGAMVSVERAQGWSRQLASHPAEATGLHCHQGPRSYPRRTGLDCGRVPSRWHYRSSHAGLGVGGDCADRLGRFAGVCGLRVVDGLSAALRERHANLGPVLALLAFLGGLFIPLDQLGETFRTLAQFTPMYGLNQLVHAPLTHDGLTWGAVINLVLWAAVFVAGAAWRFRRDTARV